MIPVTAAPITQPCPPEILDTALRAADAAGDVLLRHWVDRPAMRFKPGGSTYDLVSDADLQSEAAIVDQIRGVFPDHAILGEEGVADSSTSPLSPGMTDVPEHLWVIDPLDGTNNFAHGIPQFAVSIAYLHRGQPQVGVITNPARGEVYQCVAGGGAKSGDTAVRCSRAERLTEAMIGCGFYYDRGEMMKSTLRAIERLFGEDIHGIRRFGAAALDLVAVGLGQLDGFFEFKLSPWDFAAGGLFVHEAGGRVTTCDGQPLPIAPSSVLASNGLLHQSLMNQIR